MKVRPAAVDGLFYPANTEELRAMVTGFLADAQMGGGPAEHHVHDAAQDTMKAMIVPHAGYVYSGSTAAYGYALLEQCRDTIDHVVIVGPTHRVGIRGIALPDADAMATPLGAVPLWKDGVDVALSFPQVQINAAVHAQEHALEVQLPFLQMVLPDADVLPLAASWVEPQAVATILEAVYDLPGVFIVISSDLSHYHPYAEAQAIDQATVRQILTLEGDIDHDQACGATGINALMQVARSRHLTGRLLAQCTSGDTAGDKKAVVGYATIAFTEEEA